MKVVPFTLDHGHIIQELTIEDTGQISRNTMKFWISHGISRSVFSGGILVGCAGVYQIHPGVGQTWMLLSKDRAKMFPVSIMKAVKEGISASFNSMKLHRVQSLVNSELESAVLFIESLGFVREGLLWEYGPDKKDYYMYSLLRRHAI